MVFTGLQKKVWTTKTPPSLDAAMASNVVETISLNYEDFNDSFLTCATCLCRYDSTEHVPKLLPCSHTLCVQCLQRISENATKTTFSSSSAPGRGVPPSESEAAAAVGESSAGNAAPSTTVTTKIRCPICRSSITVPTQGGVHALPPSFIINQLLDLIGSMRKNIVMKCSSHTSEDLMFCETCDETFCMLCHSIRRSSLESQMKPFDARLASLSSASDNDMNSDYDSGCDDITRRRSPTGPLTASLAAHSHRLHTRSHNNAKSSVNSKISCDHSSNAVPVTVAAKRLSNILNYKAIGCRSLVDKGLQQITTELRELDRQTHAAVDKLRTHCDALKTVIDDKFTEYERKLMTIHAQKRQVLEEQLKLVGQERAKIDENSDLGQAENVSLYTNDSNATIGSAANNDTDSNTVARLAATINLHSMAEKISILNSLMVDMPILCEPRENGYVQFVENSTTSDALRSLCNQLGTVRFSSTMPSISPLEVPPSPLPPSTNMQRRHELKTGLCDIAGILQCYDCHGRRRVDGGDPVEAFVVSDDIASIRASVADFSNNSTADTDNVECHVVDRNDGSYEIRCRPPRAGTYKLHVRLFGRHVKSSPLTFYAVSNYPPESSTNGLTAASPAVNEHDGQDRQIEYDNDETDAELGLAFCQPAAIVYDPANERLLVVDTGNERLVIVSRDLKRTLRVYANLPGMEFHGATGATLLANGNVVLVNWRTRYITECSLADDCALGAAAANSNAFAANRGGGDQMLAVDGGASGGRRSTSFSSSSVASMKSVVPAAVIDDGTAAAAAGESGEVNEAELEKRQRLVKRFTHQDLKTPMKIDYRRIQHASDTTATIEELLVVDNDANALFVFDYRSCKLKRKMTWPTLLLGEAAGRLPMHAATWWHNNHNNFMPLSVDNADCLTCIPPLALPTNEQLRKSLSLPSPQQTSIDFVVTDNLVRIYTKNGALLYQLGTEVKSVQEAALCALNGTKTAATGTRRHLVPISTQHSESGDGSTLRNTPSCSLAGSNSGGSHTLRADSVNISCSSTLLASGSSGSRADNKFSSLKRLRAKSTHYYATLHSFFQHGDSSSGGKGGGDAADSTKTAKTVKTKSSTLVSRWQSSSKSKKKSATIAATSGSAAKNVNSDDGDDQISTTQTSDVRVVVVPWNREDENHDADDSPPATALNASAADDAAVVPTTKTASNLSLDSLVGLPYGDEDDDDSLFVPSSIVSSTESSFGNKRTLLSSNPVYAISGTLSSSSYTAVAIDSSLSYVLCARTVRGRGATIEVHAVRSVPTSSTDSVSRNSSGEMRRKAGLDVQLAAAAGTSSSNRHRMMLCAGPSVMDSSCSSPSLVLRIDSRGARLRSVCSLAVDVEHRRVYACDAVAGSIKMFRYA